VTGQLDDHPGNHLWLCRGENGSSYDNLQAIFKRISQKIVTFLVKAISNVPDKTHLDEDLSINRDFAFVWLS